MRLENRQMTWAWLGVAAVFFFASQSTLAAIGTIVGSKHDFSSTSASAYKGASTQVCVYCHAPHNSTGGNPLWNHTASAATYTLYSNSSLNATMAQPAGVSKLCLSCHDGTIAIDSFGGGAGTPANLAAGSVLLGTDLSNDHPIGFTYDAALVTADGGLKAITSAVTIGTGNTGTIATKMLVGGQLECASCHDVHNSTANTAVEAKLLRVTTAGSALCIACHNK